MSPDELPGLPIRYAGRHVTCPHCGTLNEVHGEPIMALAEKGFIAIECRKCQEPIILSQIKDNRK